MKNVFVLLLLCVSFSFSMSLAADMTPIDTTESMTKVKLHPVTGEMTIQIGREFVEVAKIYLPSPGIEFSLVMESGETTKVDSKLYVVKSPKTKHFIFRRSRDGLSCK